MDIAEMFILILFVVFIIYYIVLFTYISISVRIIAYIILLFGFGSVIVFKYYEDRFVELSSTILTEEEPVLEQTQVKPNFIRNIVELDKPDSDKYRSRVWYVLINLFKDNKVKKLEITNDFTYSLKPEDIKLLEKYCLDFYIDLKLKETKSVVQMNDKSHIDVFNLFLNYDFESIKKYSSSIDYDKLKPEDILFLFIMLGSSFRTLVKEDCLVPRDQFTLDVLKDEIDFLSCVPITAKTRDQYLDTLPIKRINLDIPNYTDSTIEERVGWNIKNDVIFYDDIPTETVKGVVVKTITKKDIILRSDDTLYKLNRI